MRTVRYNFPKQCSECIQSFKELSNLYHTLYSINDINRELMLIATKVFLSHRKKMTTESYQLLFY